MGAISAGVGATQERPYTLQPHGHSPHHTFSPTTRASPTQVWELKKNALLTFEKEGEKLLHNVREIPCPCERRRPIQETFNIAAYIYRLTIGTAKNNYVYNRLLFILNCCQLVCE